MEEVMSLDAALNHINSFIFLKNKAPHALHSYIKNTLKHIDLPIPTLHFKKSHHLFRCRKHYKNDPCFFEDIDDISYRKEVFNIKEFGRANEPVQSIFYCSDNFNTAIKESSAFFTSNCQEVEEITIGVWEVQKNFKIGNLIVKDFSNGIHKTNKTVKKLLELFKLDMQKYPKEHIIIFETLLSYFAEEFLVKTPTKEEYFITSAIANYIYNEFGKGLSAFVYPSAIEPNIGMNFTIKPELLYKNNALKLVGACKIKLEKGIEINKIIAKDINKTKKKYIGIKVFLLLIFFSVK